MKLLSISITCLLAFTACKDTKKEALTLDTLPKDWVRLTEKDGHYIIYNSCDAGNLLIKISKKEKQFSLLLYGQQEDSEYEILESSERNDTLLLKAKLKEADEKQEFKFYWTDKAKGLGRFVTTFSSGFTSNNLFVSSDQQKKFKTVDQPCRECWGDECDEMEKENTNTIK